MIEGKVTPPKDLTPAIEALGDRGKAYLMALASEKEIQPWMIAKAADYERGDG